MLGFSFESYVWLTLLSFHGKISILSSVANNGNNNELWECTSFTSWAFGSPNPAYIILRMDPGNLMNIVFIAHLLLVSLLCRNFPLFSGFSLISSAWPVWSGSPWLLQPCLSPPHTLAPCRAPAQSAFPHLWALSRSFFLHSLPGSFFVIL